MKVTYTDMNVMAAGCYAITAVSGHVFEKKASIRAAKICAASWIVGTTLIIGSSVLYLTGKIDY